MADEASVRISLAIRKTDEDSDILLIDYQSRPNSFKADVDDTFGPAPGSVIATVALTQLDLTTGFTSGPGLCWLMNKSTTLTVEYGIYDPDSGKFFPLGELLPGEAYVLRLSRYLGQDLVATSGTGTFDTTQNTKLALKVLSAGVFGTGTAEVAVHAFGR